MNCLSCGNTSATRSGEHVFAQWLLDYLHALKTPITHFRYQADGTSTPHRDQIALDSLRLKRICEPCNNGWMSRLEDHTKAILVGLMERTLALDALADEQRRLLARWAGKTAIIESYAVGAEKPIDAQLLGYRRDGDQTSDVRRSRRSDLRPGQKRT